MVELVERVGELVFVPAWGGSVPRDLASPREGVTGLEGVASMFQATQVWYDSMTFQSPLIFFKTVLLL